MPFGRYVLQQRMARGGMGEVFRAKAVGASGFEKPVVVKRLLPQLTGQHIVAEMFVKEAKVMSRLAHPNIVQVIDFGQGDQDDYFLVLELVDGVDLGKFRQCFEQRGDPVPVPLVLYIVNQILRGLRHAHERAYDDDRVLVHRDVSPANVLLSAVGEVKVADFGVAHVAQPGGEEAAAQRVVGKPGYMAPEQLTGDRVDPRADVFAAGAVMFELLTHQLPGEATRQARADGRLGRREAAAPSWLRPGLSAELDAVLAQALATLPERRFSSARAMAKAIESLHAEGERAATADDLAEAVQRVRAASTERAKPVIQLGANAPEPETPVRELTRIAPNEPFTMRISAPPDPPAPAQPVASHAAAEATAAKPAQTGEPTERVDEPEPSHWLNRGLLLRMAALLVVLVGGSWWFWSTSDDTAKRTNDGEADAAGTADTVESPSTAAATDSGGGNRVPEPDTATGNEPAGEAASSAPSGPPPPDRAAPRAAGGTWPPPSGVAKTAEATAAAGPPTPPPACRGQVHLYANHAWVVTGGPSVVQAPGRYTWACGSYGLRATSRLDPAETKQLSVVVRDSRASVVDLR